MKTAIVEAIAISTEKPEVSSQVGGGDGSGGMMKKLKKTFKLYRHGSIKE